MTSRSRSPTTRCGPPPRACVLPSLAPCSRGAGGPGGVPRQAGVLFQKLRCQWEVEVSRCPHAPKLQRALWRTFRDVYAIFFVIQLIKSAAVLAQTQFLALLLLSLGSPSTGDWEG